MDVIQNLRIIGQPIDDLDENPQANRRQNLERVVQSILNCMTEEQLNEVKQDFYLNDPKRG